MTLRPTPAVFHVLLACFLCALWCDAVIATAPATANEKIQSVTEVVENALETTQKILADLKTAENCANKQEDIEKVDSGTNLTPHATKTKSNGEELSAAVTNATERAKGVVDAVKAVEKTLTEGELKTLMTEAVEKSNNLFTAVSKANTKAQEIHATVQTSRIAHEKNLIANQMNIILPLLREAEKAANLNEQFFQEAVKKAVGMGGKLQGKSKNVNNLPAETSQGAAGNGSRKGETQHTGRPQDSDMNSPPGTRDNEQSTPKRDTLSSALHEGNNRDSTPGGAIATCTTAPLLLLLTAVAYAAVC